MDEAPRALPHDVSAEMGVLGSMLLTPEALNAAREKLESDSFYKLSHQIIFDAIIELFDEHNTVDLIIVRDGLKRRGQLEKVGGISYLQELAEAPPASVNVEYYAEIVHEKAVRRNLIQTSSRIQKQCHQDTCKVEELLDDAERAILSVRHMRGGGEAREMPHLMQDVLEDLAEREAGTRSGIPTGFSDLDRIINGFHDGEFIIIAARPSVGKTTLCLNMAHYICHVERCPAVFYSLEMGAKQLTSNILCIHNRLDTQDFRRADLDNKEWADLEMSIEDMAEMPLHVDDTPALRIGELRARARRMCQQHGVEVIFVDYLQLLRPSKARNMRSTEVSEISAGLKALARELDVPLVAVAQLNRSSAKEGRKPRMSDLRESGALEQDADVIMLLHRPDDPSEESFEKSFGDDYGGPTEGSLPGSEADLIIDKQRNGPTGVCPLVFLKRHLRFESRAQLYHDVEQQVSF